MTTNRRQFVTSLVGVPLLLSPATALSAATQLASRDPVLDQILSDLRDLTADAKARPESRKATLRAIETNLGIQAAHIGANYDSQNQRSLRRRLSRAGRAGVTTDAVTFAHRGQHGDVTADTVDAAMTELDKRGFAGVLRDAQRTLRQVRLQAPDAVQLAALRPAQFDYCLDLRWQIQMLEAMLALTCAIALVEPTPFLEAGCAAMGIVLAALLFVQMLWC